MTPDEVKIIAPRLLQLVRHITAINLDGEHIGLIVITKNKETFELNSMATSEAFIKGQKQ